MGKKRKRREKSSDSSPTTSDKRVDNKQANKAAQSNTPNFCVAQNLKKHRGTAASTPPPPIYTNPSRRSFLAPDDDPQAFEECLNTSYRGFRYDSPSETPNRLHEQFESSFRGMDNLFLYDTIQPGKKRLTRTSVTRTLVGEPGSTYKYLGLRLFSHPWVDVDEKGDATNRGHNAKKPGFTLRNLGYPEKTTSALIEMGRANDYLKERSKELLEKFVSPNVIPTGLVGSADYNLTLVNKMASTATKRDLKKENTYGMGKVSVGWHRDSGLKDFSSIAVYQTLQGVTNKKSCDGWGVALRAMDGGAGGPLTSVPALLVPLPSGSLYYMFDDFNHNHEHAVIAGSDGIRFSSTHRVAREGQGTWQYIRDKTEQFFILASKFDFSTGNAINMNDGPNASAKKQREKFVSLVRAQQILVNEIEFEWLRQWFVQGQKHSSLHNYWHQPMEKLCASFCKLEKSSVSVVNLLRRHATKSGDKNISEDLYDVIIEYLSERLKMRKAWKERYNDPVFEEIPVDERPMNCPCLDRAETADVEKCFNVGQMPNPLDDLIEQIRDWRSVFVATNQSSQKKSGREVIQSRPKKQSKSNAGSLTRKEQKRVASNWEKLRKRL